jgi:O-antigen ligase
VIAPDRLADVRSQAGNVAWLGAAGASGVAIAYLSTQGYWYVAVVLLLLTPAFVILQRHPLVGVAVWMVLTPLVVATESSAIRQIFWVIHRTLPPVVLLLVVAGSISGASSRRLTRLGLPELLMGGYVAASVLSLMLTSDAFGPGLVLLYDRVVMPMCLYLIVRLLEPTSHDLRWLALVALCTLAVEIPVGVLTIASPGSVPEIWLVGAQRASGTFGDPDTYGTAMILCAVILLHAGTVTTRRGIHLLYLFGFTAAMIMVFLTFSRANWLAGLVAFVGCLWIFREKIGSLVLAAPLVLAGLLAIGVLQGPLSFAQERLESSRSRESALARLPVGLAATRMFAAQPITGWGMGNFDAYSRPFFDDVANIASAEKDHASHNLFLTIAAEQGLIGLVLFLGPTAIWARRSTRAYTHMPTSERQLLAGLWLVIAAFFVVNNFSVMKSAYGLGAWWLSLGLVASIVDRFRPPAHVRELNA